MSDQTRELARVTHADIGDVYNGMLGLCVTFEYEGSSGQGLGGYILDASFVIRFVNAIGAPSLSKCVGRSCWVTHDHSSISKVEPLHAKDGKVFVIADWKKWIEGNNFNLCYADLEGRK